MSATQHYHSRSAELPVQFEYPADWEAEYSRGSTEAYAQVQVYAPSAVESRLRSYLVVRAVPSGSSGGAIQTSRRWFAPIARGSSAGCTSMESAHHPSVIVLRSSWRSAGR